MNELAKIGWKVVWIGDKVDITKGKTKLPAIIKGNTPVLPLEMCLELIEEIEKEKMTIKDPKKMTLDEAWPQLKYAIAWMLQNKVEGAMDLLNLIACRRRREIDLEKKESSEPEKTESPKVEKTADQPKIEEFKNMLDIEVIENPKSEEESNKYVLVATLQHEESLDQKDGNGEQISVKAFQQTYDDKRERKNLHGHVATEKLQNVQRKNWRKPNKYKRTNHVNR